MLFKIARGDEGKQDPGYRGGLTSSPAGADASTWHYQGGIERVLNEGWEATDAKPGTLGRVMVFPYEAEWEGQFYREKEVTVYYKVTDEELILLTAKARYGQGFPRR